MQIKVFFQKLSAYRQFLTRQEFKTVRGQALAGDFEAAEKGLKNIIRRKGLNIECST